MTARTPAAPADTAAQLAEALAPLGLTVLDAASALTVTVGTAVVLLEEWTLGLAEELSRHALAHPVRLVPVRLDGSLCVLGPVLRPGAAACLRCAEYQRLASAGGRVPWQGPQLQLAGVASPALVEALALLAADLLQPEQEADSATVRIVHNGRATWSSHQVRPVGGCALCRPLPADTAEAAELPSTSRPLPDPGVLRGANSRTDSAGLRAALHDERFGPVRRLFRSEQSLSSLTTAYVTDGRMMDSGGYGRGGDFDSSERVALFESIERLAGMRPHGRRTALRAGYAELAERAAQGGELVLDPERLGLPDPAYHGHPASYTVPYTPLLQLDWVHGWSLTRARPIAVPEHVAYWEVPGAEHRVVYESSNGCGLGNSPQEAVLYGLFEVAERDAFLMAWYGATPLRRIALPLEDPEVAHFADRTALAGYRLSLLDATNDLGVPAVLAVCRYTGTHPDAPRAFLAAGAHHDPLTAIRSAVAEVVTNVHEAAQRALSTDRPFAPERLRPMLEQPELVRSLDDHVGLGTLPETAHRLDALFAEGPELDRRELWPTAPQPVADLTALLDATVRRLAALDLEVIAVGQDEAGLRDRLGLHCAKVIVPGTLAMTFGHVNRRTRGLPRLLEVPYRLGRVERPLRHDELALHPHPFP